MGPIWIQDIVLYRGPAGCPYSEAQSNMQIEFEEGPLTRAFSAIWRQIDTLHCMQQLYSEMSQGVHKSAQIVPCRKA